MQQYPAELEERIELANRMLWLRPIRPDDLEREQRFVHDLSPDTAYLRFFSPLHELSAEMAERFTRVDYERSMALIALDQPDAAPEIVGVARYVALTAAGSCEFALTIADRWQRKGLGRLLLERLIRYARSQGFKSMVGSVMLSNAGMRALAAALGFVAAPDPGDPTTLEVKLALQ